MTRKEKKEEALRLKKEIEAKHAKPVEIKLGPKKIHNRAKSKHHRLKSDPLVKQLREGRNKGAYWDNDPWGRQ